MAPRGRTLSSREASPRNAARALVVMGVSGSGKSTLGRLLATELGWEFVDGDDLHPAANIAKMSAGHALTDADRGPWLAVIAAWIDDRLAHGQGGVVACSALTRAYRDVLRRPGVCFVYLHGPPELLHERLMYRVGHFMPAGLLDSQLAVLEPPGPDERAVTVDVRRSPVDQLAAVIAAVAD